ncbi:hypothetical protein DF118_32380 [Burkholderia stagnalis]|uniref:hypothetical protein n=1 Tax=Burkholderia stagnalis TaxID=1503054 RepID=UPI000F5CE30C|nr:hypothetical protein [Burkholderia stagnalis]RQY03764.1 hypothetical protein DF118_32380 [Burkholderia stagnalis]RQY50975.1 hypothetical protein DF109_32495 [Burkholderia stagnalis]
MNIVRLNGHQRAALSGTEIDGRAFVEVDIVHTLPDGEESLTRLLISAERAAVLAEALLAARDDVEPARLERS